MAKMRYATWALWPMFFGAMLCLGAVVPLAAVLATGEANVKIVALLPPAAVGLALVYIGHRWGRTMEQDLSAPKETLLGDLRDYGSVLHLLVQTLEAHGDRSTITALVQRLTNLDLGRLLTPVFDLRSAHLLPQLQHILREISADANSAGKHLGATRGPASLQEVVHRAYRAQSQAEYPPALLLLIPNILLVTRSTLEHIEAQLASAPAPAPTPAPPPAGGEPRSPTDTSHDERTLASAIVTIASFFRRAATEKELTEALEATVRCSCGAAFVLASASKTVKEGNSLSMVFTCPACGSTSAVKYG